MSVKSYTWYLLFFILGITVAVMSPLNATKETLLLIEAVTLSALIASFLVPFAAFAKNEQWQQFALQYAAVPLFGVWTVIAWKNSSTIGLFVLICASAVHFGFWMSGIHSRAYRFDQFKLGFARDMPTTSRVIAMLNGQRRSHESDRIVSAILAGRELLPNESRDMIQRDFGSGRSLAVQSEFQCASAHPPIKVSMPE